MSLQRTEIAIIGGGPAGLSAALTLARARRRVVVIDSGDPRNATAAGAHGLLGLEGIPPLELLETGRREVAAYGGRILGTRLTNAHRDHGAFHLTTDDGQQIVAPTVLIASGTRDLLPDLPGLRARWGRDVIHCPYCHGWEVRDQRIGVLATGPMSALQALMFRQWSSRVQFFPQGVSFPEDQLAKLAAMGVDRVPGRATGLEVRDDRLAALTLDSGAVIQLDALVLPTSTEARLDGLGGLGLETTESPLGVALVADASGHTSVPGVWAAGNVANPAMQVSGAAATGARVAMALNTELVFAQAELALGSAEM